MVGGAPQAHGVDADYTAAVSSLEGGSSARGENVDITSRGILAAVRVETMDELSHQLQGQGVENVGVPCCTTETGLYKIYWNFGRGVVSCWWVVSDSADICNTSYA